MIVYASTEDPQGPNELPIDEVCTVPYLVWDRSQFDGALILIDEDGCVAARCFQVIVFATEGGPAVDLRGYPPYEDRYVLDGEAKAAAKLWAHVKSYGDDDLRRPFRTQETDVITHYLKYPRNVGDYVGEPGSDEGFWLLES